MMRKLEVNKKTHPVILTGHIQSNAVQLLLVAVKSIFHVVRIVRENVHLPLRL